MFLAQGTRDHSLDAFRGLTVVLMVIVNIQGSGDAAFAALKHAEWHGLTFADLVFPWFLFIVGLSLPLALDRGQSGPQWRKVIRRSIILFLWGMILAWLIRPSFDPAMIRWAGVLQRIGIVYLVCALIILFRPGFWLSVLLASVVLLFHTGLILGVTAPGEVAPSIDAGKGISGWFDQQFLPGRVLRKSWDPEGIMSTFPAIASGLIGVAVMRWIRLASGAVEARLLVTALILTIIGYALTMLVPINKGLWSASFVLVTAGLGLALWMVLRLIWAGFGEAAIARWLVLLGQTALTLYVIHMLLIAVIVRKWPGEARIWDSLYGVLASTGLSPPLASLIFALLAAALCVAPLGALKRRGWLIKA